MKIAPVPRRLHSRSMAIYTAMENLNGSATRLDLYKECRRIWSEIVQEKPPSNLSQFQQMLSRSAISQGYIVRQTNDRKAKNPVYNFAAYDVFRSKAEPSLLSRTMYSLSKIENGEQAATKSRIAKLERILEDPSSELPPPREWSPKRDTPKHSQEAVKEAAEKAAEKLEPPSDIQEMLKNIDKIIERQKPSETPVTPSKLEVPIWPAVIGVSIAGIAILVAVSLSVLAFAG